MEGKQGELELAGEIDDEKWMGTDRLDVGKESHGD